VTQTHEKGDSDVNRLASKVAIVTGAASGIGRATAIRLASDGASVVIADINVEGSEQTASLIEAAGGTALAITTDIGQPDQITALVDGTVARFGQLDIVHNNAADTSSRGVGRDKDLLSITSDLWDSTLNINLRGPMLVCRAAVPVMRRGGGGSIINTTSLSGMTGDLIYTAYGVSKAGLIILTKYIATQYGKDGIRCNAVSPGLILTTDSADRAPRDDENLAKYAANILVPEHGTPNDVANVVAFLASDDARFITGEVIRVDGGMQSHITTLGHLRPGLEDSLAADHIAF
jgi:NAD(P)-dependent dehydrogenase (short-subunit alcohol dehydrogenase family)